MTTDASVSISDSAILSRLEWPEDSQLSVAAATGLLSIRFRPTDLDRIHDLLIKNQDGVISADEQIELDNLTRVSFLLDLLHSRARRALQPPPLIH